MPTVEAGKSLTQCFKFMPSFMINSYHNFEVPILESTTNGLVKSISTRPLLQKVLQDVSALSLHINNV
ncbi:hypothetical protein AMATHDRAFT_10503 [Amanita thiersii Skay4041]|uniref:Uncharacterized protein n=1 Tax=Amanita thiersii Skay4041 TaxID=703135 RepID=A0A2A9N9L4_9AGAR|nr:hypothetical protein AMATHDRAFT_10503 [Amanita thiersii Skay4041]